MPASWEVWSVSVGEGRAVVVGEGDERAMVAAAGIKNMAAERHAPGLVFMALREGETPTAEAAQAILLERDGVAPLTPAEREDPEVFAEIAGDRAATWQPVLMDLLELELNGQLEGVRAIVAELLRMVREPMPFTEPGELARHASRALAGGSYARAGALLAAEIAQAP